MDQETPQNAAGRTKQALLDAAEELFGEHGIARASLRAITSRAKANLAAAHYHFGSKEALVRAVIARHLEPMNRRRLEMLDAAEAAAETELTDVVRAFVEPVVRHGLGQRGQHFARLFGRAFSAPEGVLRSVIHEELGEVIRRFKAAFHRALPHLSEVEILWRIHFMVGSMAHSMAGGAMLEKISEGRCQSDPPEELLEELICFATAALSAPSRQEEPK